MALQVGGRSASDYLALEEPPPFISSAIRHSEPHGDVDAFRNQIANTITYEDINVQVWMTVLQVA